MNLRWYQREAVSEVYDHLRNRHDNPCVVMPTGSGKSPVIGQIVRDSVDTWGGRVLVIAHRKELLLQNVEKIKAFNPSVSVGIYSAGLNRRDTAQSVILGGIQSIANRACEFGPFDLILVDEAHLIPAQGEGRYRRFIEEAKKVNPHVRVIGFTATPYRLDSGVICAQKNILNRVCYKVGIKPLISQGFLSGLVSRNGASEGIVETEGVHTRGGEFVQGDLEKIATKESAVVAACKEIYALTRRRQSVLIFCVSVSHAQRVYLQMTRLTDEKVSYVVGETNKDDRAKTLDAFKRGKLKYLINCNVLTEGFDAPNIDCTVLLRPTKSPGLYAQMVGRGLRIAKGKKDCLVLDYGENIFRHGPIDEISSPSKKTSGDPLAKMCTACRAMVSLGCKVCPDCGFEFPIPDRPDDIKHERKASYDLIISRPIKREWVDVDKVYYETHIKRGADKAHPRTVRVEYKLSLTDIVSEWICIEHPDGSFANIKANKWWCQRQPGLGPKVPMPKDCEAAILLLRSGRLKEPGRIEVIRGARKGDFDKIVGYEFPLRSGEFLSDINKKAKEVIISEGEIPF